VTLAAVAFGTAGRARGDSSKDATVVRLIARKAAIGLVIVARREVTEREDVSDLIPTFDIR
jgi:hypothetical protein